MARSGEVEERARSRLALPSASRWSANTRGPRLPSPACPSAAAHLVDQLHVPRHARQRLLLCGRLPQEEREVVAACGSAQGMRAVSAGSAHAWSARRGRRRVGRGDEWALRFDRVQTANTCVPRMHRRQGRAAVTCDQALGPSAARGIVPLLGRRLGRLGAWRGGPGVVKRAGSQRVVCTADTRSDIQSEQRGERHGQHGAA